MKMAVHCWIESDSFPVKGEGMGSAVPLGVFISRLTQPIFSKELVQGTKVNNYHI
jgi:hypothetical protein